ncbi:unnamed protein product [Caretta caretta]
MKCVYNEVVSLLAHRDDQDKGKIALRIAFIAETKLAIVLTVLLEKLQKDEQSRVDIYCALEKVLQQDTQGLERRLLEKIITLASNHMRETQEATNELKVAASNTLVTLARCYFNDVMCELLYRLELPEEFIFITLGNLSSAYDRDKHLQDLCQAFLQLQYPPAEVKKQIDRARRVPRSHLLQDRPNKENNRTPLAVTFSPQLKPLQRIIKDLQPILKDDPTLSQVLGDRPVLAYRQPRNLKQILTNNHIPHNRTTNPGTYPCNKARCQLCPHIYSGDTITGPNNISHTIRGSFTCTSTNVIYAIMCQQCPSAMYIGQTGQALRKRINGHKSDVKNYNIHKPVGEHFNLSGHAITDMKVAILKQKNFKSRLQRETAELEFICKLDTINLGLNRDWEWLSHYASALECIPFVGMILNVMISMLELVKDSRMRQAFCGEWLESLSQLLEVSGEYKIPLPKGKFQAICSALYNQICSPAKQLSIENHKELFHCVLLLARSSPDDLLAFLHEQLEIEHEAVPVASLDLLRAIVGADLPETRVKKLLIVKAAKSSLSDQNATVRKAALHFIRTLLSSGRVENCAAWDLVAYVFSEFSVSTSKLDVQEESTVQTLCIDILQCLDTSVNGMTQVSWPRLLGSVVTAQYTGTLKPLCRCLRELAEKRQQEGEAAAASTTVDGVYNRNSFISSLQCNSLHPRGCWRDSWKVVASSPYEREGHGCAALRLLKALHQTIHAAVGVMWGVEIPSLLQYIEVTRTWLLL